MSELLLEIAGSLMRLPWGLLTLVLEHSFWWKLPGSKRNPSKAVKLVIKSKSGEKHGVLEDHTKR